MALPRSRKDREQQKFVDDGSGNVAVRAVVIGGGGGAVSSVSNSDGTLTVSPTTGAVVASLNLGNANSWTAQQTLGANTRFRATAVTGGVAYAQFETGLGSGSYANQFGAGTTVPGAVAGWSGAAIFTDADATTFNRTWLNIGTSASAEFVRIAYLNSNGQLAFEDGTAALPIYTFASDPDTGMTSLGANTLGFSAGGVTRMQVNSGTNVNFALQVNFSSSTAPTAAVYGIGRGTTDLTTNVPTGATHQTRVNGTNVVTAGVAGLAVVPAGSAAAPSVALGGFQSGLYLTGSANTAIASQGVAVTEFISGGRMDFLAGTASVSGSIHSVGRNTSNAEVYLNAPSSNRVAFRINNGLNAYVDGNSLFNVTGTFSKYAAVGGKVYDNVTTTGNVGTGEDTLVSYSLPASLLGLDNQSITIKAAGTFANNSNNKRVRLNYGGQVVFDTGILSVTTGTDWSLEVTIKRTSGTTAQKNIGVFTSNAVGATQVVDYTATTINVAAAQTLTITGEATADNDIVHQFSEIYHNQASA